MGNARYDTPFGPAGYDVADACHQDGCPAEINRGLAHLCGDQPGRESEHGCGRWFCSVHLYGGPEQSLGGHCRACLEVAQREQAGGRPEGSTDSAPSGERIPHLMVGLVRGVETSDPDDVDYRVGTACGVDRNVALITSDRAQVCCPACWKAVEDADARAQGRTDVESDPDNVAETLRVTP